MPGQIRQNKKALKIFNEIMKPAKDQRQDNQKKPSEKMRNEWFRDSSTAQ